ncbi:hypothetical protein UFOVP247_83 [uncultured Caudovirales phage]|uniref:Uncharacterized protein n=1 Tax=uncultured Caudovirales phage TaxID=2100421 RepID=A0A6J7WYF4_9CAUD|nr:hypothetical protein UFOVP247_83 [uncultured Caudovirales phage]
MTKTPFEIRFDLLNFAQSQLTGQYYADLERAREIRDEAERETVISQLNYPTKSDIVFLAEELKNFVDSK